MTTTLTSTTAKTFHLKDLSINSIGIYNKGKSVNLSFDNEPLKFSVGPMFLPFGVKIYPNKWTNVDDISIDCSLNQRGENYELLDNKMTELNEHISNLISNHEGSLKGSVFSSFYKNNNPSYPKLCKLNFTRDQYGNFKTIIYNENREKIHYNEKSLSEIMCKGTIFNVLIASTKIWNTQAQKSGVQFDIDQILILKPAKKLQVEENQENQENKKCVFLD